MDNYKKQKSKLDLRIREQCKNTGWKYNALSYYLKEWDKLLIPKESTPNEYEYHKTTAEEYTNFLIDIKNEVNDIILTRFKTNICFSSCEDITEFNLSKFIKDKYPNNKFNMFSKIKENYRIKMQMIERFKKVFGNINRSVERQREYYKSKRQELKELEDDGRNSKNEKV